MKQQLIETQVFNLSNIIREGKYQGNPMVEGILATVEQQNGNGRYYSKPLWEREIQKYIDGPVKENRALGELDHADDEIIHLQKASHIIRDIWWDGSNVMGKIEILPTPMGKILITLLENNVMVGVSSRGMGSVQQMGELLEVQDDFELVCFDFVSTPSNHNSWMHPVKGTINENKQFNPNLVNKYISVNKILNHIIHSL